MTETKCSNCKYFRKLKHNFERGKGFDEDYCCVVWEYVDVDDAGERWVQEVGKNSMCEMFDDGTDNKE